MKSQNRFIPSVIFENQTSVTFPNLVAAYRREYDRASYSQDDGPAADRQYQRVKLAANLIENLHRATSAELQYSLDSILEADWIVSYHCITGGAAKSESYLQTVEEAAKVLQAAIQLK